MEYPLGTSLEKSSVRKMSLSMTNILKIELVHASAMLSFSGIQVIFNTLPVMQLLRGICTFERNLQSINLCRVMTA